MEIKHEQIETLALSLAAMVGQAAAATMITEEYHKLGGGNLPLVVGNIWNNQQNIFHRWLEGRTPHQRLKIRELAPAIQAAHAAELAQQNKVQIDVAIANRECIEATSAKLMGKSLAVIQQETLEAIDALAQLAGVTVHIAHERRAA
ncbi:toxin YdaT family protein [Lelliottia wanjuensis]|uniref:toxin YdaT family protein n=1 Tax=Lelliottia wanjuensis TaxID=3050585 RepID=UPI00254D094F|nr:toxin YdaT family protein [Lelliottia sp. V86_10]MDK9585448.1 toxin YdaT family protein [Lelliottia sp. V86_10]